MQDIFKANALVGHSPVEGNNAGINDMKEAEASKIQTVDLLVLDELNRQSTLSDTTSWTKKQKEEILHSYPYLHCHHYAIQ